MSGGLSVGKEGPFVHIAAAIADNIMRCRPFRNIHERDGRRLEVLSHASAAGVASCFGTAFGGVLFALEFTSTSYTMSMLPEAFSTAVISIALMSLIGMTGAQTGSSLFSNSDIVSPFPSISQGHAGNGDPLSANPNSTGGVSLENLSASAHEMTIFVLIGAVLGLLGSCFVVVVDAISARRNKLLSPIMHSEATVLQRKYLYVLIATLVIAPMVSLSLEEL
mgnify:CR=1 FL=1